DASGDFDPAADYFITSDTCVVTYTVNDTQAPVGNVAIAVPNQESCFADVAANFPFDAEDVRAEFTDNCSDDADLIIDGVFNSLVGDDCAWTLVYGFTVEDECGNIENGTITY